MISLILQGVGASCSCQVNKGRMMTPDGSTADVVPCPVSRPAPPPEGRKERNPAQQSAKVKDQHQTTSACLPAYTYIHLYRSDLLSTLHAANKETSL